ncbi:MAG: DUF2017 family protein [Acidimicrobiia bacterium]|jgi:hypothetical protein
MRIKPGRDGSVQITFDLAEVELLHEVPDQLRLLYEAPPDDPARSRLFPRAYLDPTEEKAEQQWQAVVHPELVRERLAGLERVLGALDGGDVKSRRVRVSLTADDVSVWLAVLNDARLAFACRLEIDDDTDVYRYAPDDPLALEMAAYAWLTTLQGALVETLLGTLPG